MKIKVRGLYLLTKISQPAAAAVNLKENFSAIFKLTEKCILLIPKHILLRPLVPLVDTRHRNNVQIFQVRICSRPVYLFQNYFCAKKAISDKVLMTGRPYN